MENKPSQSENSANRTPRISRRRALTAGLAVLGIGALSAIDSKFGVAPAPVKETSTPTSMLPPREAATPTPSLTATPITETKKEIPKKEIIEPTVETLEGKERAKKLDELDQFFHEFFKPEAVEEFRDKGWLNDENTLVERVSTDGVETVIFRDKRYGEVKGKFINDPRKGVLKAFEVNTTSEEPNLKVFLNDLRPRLAYDSLEFYKQVLEFEEDEIPDAKSDGLQTLDRVIQLPEDEIIDPDEDSKIIRIFAGLPLSHKLYREHNDHYVKEGEIAVIAGNSIAMVTTYTMVSPPHGNQIV